MAPQDHVHSVKETMDVIDFIDALAVEVDKHASDGVISGSEGIQMVISLMDEAGAAIDNAGKIEAELANMCEEDAAAIGAASTRAVFKLVKALGKLRPKLKAALAAQG